MTKQEEPKIVGIELIGRWRTWGPWPAKRCRQDAGTVQAGNKYKLEDGRFINSCVTGETKPKLSKSFERSRNTSAKGPCSLCSAKISLSGRQRA